MAPGHMYIRFFPISRILPLFAGIALFSALLQCGMIRPSEGRSGVVQFTKEIPAECNTTTGLKQKVVRAVYSERELVQHYGLSFQVHFNDKKSPDLYGALYYQNRDTNLYCMALPDGRFAVFQDSHIDEHKRNVIHEVCYPLKDCSQP